MYVLILAGGGGTRLWPLSREHSPKQFLKIFDGKSLFQHTLERARRLVPASRIYISTAQKYLSYVKKEAADIPDENIIGEPMRRDTALAQGLGALIIHQRDPRAIIINLASDHLISPVSKFVSDMQLAAKFAAQDKFVTVGIRPRFPHTGMGHIQVRGTTGVRFVEKPSLELAEEYTASGNYLWNANLYVWPAKLILDLLKKYSPKTTAFFPRIAAAIGTDSEKQVLQAAFQMAPTISIDYAVSEKIQNFVCIKASFTWSDIGDWSEVQDNLPADAMGNVILGTRGRGEHIGVNSRKNLLVLDKQLIVTVGVENMLIVDTPEAILICNVNDDQAVKQVHQILKEQKLLKYL